MTIKINGTNTTAQPSITGTDTDTGLVYGTGQVSVVTDGTERLRVDSSGNVGIGTTSPDALLHLKNISPFIRFTDSADDTHYAHIGYSDSSIYVIDADAGNSKANSAIQFKVDNTERMRIDSSGRVGIGTSSFSDSRERFKIKSPTGDGTFLTIEAPNDSGTSQLFFGDSDFNVGRISYAHSDNSLQFYTANTERLRIQSGGGISFNGDTAAANALDDYEEGTFTPSFIHYGSPTISVAQGEYVKIGNSVFLSIRMTWSGGSNSSSARISGLPFAMIDSHIAVNGWAQKGSAEGSSVYRLATTGTSNTAIYYDPIRSENSGVFYGTIQITSLP